MGLKLGKINLYWTKDKKRFFIGIPKLDNDQKVVGLKYQIEITDELTHLMFATLNGAIKKLDGDYYRAEIIKMDEKEVAQYLDAKDSHAGDAYKNYHALVQGAMMRTMGGGSLPDDFFDPVKLKKKY